MAVNEKLLERVRKAMAPVTGVKEKRMFSGITFMVKGKMCVSVGKDRIMCRIDPSLHDAAIARKGCRTVEMKGRAYTGYVYVDEDALKTKKQLDHWVQLALDFNRFAKASAKKK